MKKIIDISSYQAGANLKTAVENGVDGFIFRMGLGDNIPDQDDACFENFVNQAEQLGRPWGAYIFGYALNTENIDSEIVHALRLLDGKNPKLGVWYDLENSDYKERNGWNDFEHADTVRAWVDKFIRAMQEHGYASGLYCNLNYARNICVDGIEHLWLACYQDAPDFDNPPKNCDLWQYTSQEAVPGIAANVDCNVVYADWIKGILDGSEQGPEEDVPEPTPEADTYTVQSGDCLSIIAQRLGVDMDQLAAENNIEDVNLIYPGQVLTIPGACDGAESEPAGNEYVVREGDSLWSIAERLYGDGTRYTELAERNGIEDASLIYPGQVIRY